MTAKAPPVHPTRERLEAELDHLRAAPTDGGVLEAIVRRPRTDEREELVEARLELAPGLVGDNWATRGSRMTGDGSAHPGMQLNVMSSRVAALVAQDRERWKLAGDQLYVDLDLSEENLPAGSRLAIGDAVIEVTAQPHAGCKKFVARFGMDAMLFVNSPAGRALRLRGLNARVVEPGTVRVGDLVAKFR
ncbi:MAG TPA: MOSC domain-containing protein [Thermoanaerobaculia bacterium]|nr:MOSC domain-containing protein [Thermoanaerobaculia bacterium]